MTGVLKRYLHKNNRKKKTKIKLCHLFISGGEGEQQAKEINALVPNSLLFIQFKSWGN